MWLRPELQQDGAEEQHQGESGGAVREGGREMRREGGVTVCQSMITSVKYLINNPPVLVFHGSDPTVRVSTDCVH